MAISDEARPDEGIESPSGSEMDNTGEPDPVGGGCLKLGWGCLPLVAGIVIAVPTLFNFT
ncbi:hypothetical protein G7077_01400 [Sphingomonas piscis]|uniref:Uncharacterized protein n=1 Tax=Sphingomonas piscis TaxID=2714943 RepID=A0A6G7YM02_9SPHN|nr:hypothetical protein [Sphingomonas piscis]QIK77768.1 hypothetical protein G7077_01400 [Sphingomonas piscis]